MLIGAVKIYFIVISAVKVSFRGNLHYVVNGGNILYLFPQKLVCQVEKTFSQLSNFLGKLICLV